MIKDDIIDELIPSKNFSDFADPSFSDLDSIKTNVYELEFWTNYEILVPKNLMLDLKLQFWFESLGSIRPESADFEKSRGGQSFIQLRELITTTSVKM